MRDRQHNSLRLTAVVNNAEHNGARPIFSGFLLAA